VPYSAIFTGKTQPVVMPDYANAGDSEYALAPNTPFGLIGTSSLIWRDTNPRPGTYGGDPDPLNASHEFLYAWIHQGPDAGIYADSDIWAIRLLALFPSTDRRYPDGGPNFSNHASERMRILGEIPVQHPGVIDGNGNTDTSFLARVPANTPFTFQALDRNGMVVNMAQTWHQVRPGEGRYDCGGCHAHTKTPLAFETTVAGQSGTPAADLSLQTLLLKLTQLSGSPGTVTVPSPSVTVEYFRDVAPILAAKCAGCHTNDTADGKLNLHSDATPVTCSGNTWPGTYYRLAVDDNFDTSPGCAFGLGTPAGTPSFFLGPQQTRYIRGFQSRQSLLIWKVFNARLDGRANADRSDDIDFTASATHASLLSWDERATLTRWVDLGAPIDMCSWPGHPCSPPTWGWFEDDLRPTLWASPTVGQARAAPVTAVTVAAFDLESGLAAGTLSVSFDRTIAGRPPGADFAAGISPANGSTVTVPLGGPVDLASLGATMTVSIRDVVGHNTKIVRRFSTSGPNPSSVSPPSGSPYGGTPVTITGTGFVPGATVLLGGALLTDAVVVDSATIVATTPAHAAGPVDVMVTNPDSTTGTLAGGYTYLPATPAPTVSSISPTSGSSAGGTPVTIHGSGFVAGAAVTLGGVAAGAVHFVDSATLTADTGPHAPGMVDVTVTNVASPSGTLPAAYQYAAASLGYFTMTPCRIVDTRGAAGPLGGPWLAAHAKRSFLIAGQCGIPATARAVAGNLTVTQPTAAGDLRVFAGGAPTPLVSSVNYGLGQTRANNAVVTLGAAGDISVRCDQASGTVEFLFDVTGYFQ
jgi:hypothetical protein